MLDGEEQRQFHAERAAGLLAFFQASALEKFGGNGAAPPASSCGGAGVAYHACVRRAWLLIAGPWFLGSRFTLVDVAMMPFVARLTLLKVGQFGQSCCSWLSSVFPSARLVQKLVGVDVLAGFTAPAAAPAPGQWPEHKQEAAAAYAEEEKQEQAQAQTGPARRTRRAAVADGGAEAGAAGAGDGAAPKVKPTAAGPAAPLARLAEYFSALRAHPSYQACLPSQQWLLALYSNGVPPD
jgi:hypothetical protein